VQSFKHGKSIHDCKVYLHLSTSQFGKSLLAENGNYALTVHPNTTQVNY